MVPRLDDEERFLDALRRSLDLDASDRERVVTEFRSHLTDSIAEAEGRGMGREAAVREALARIGDPRAVARAYDRSHPIHNALVALGATACVGVAAWLVIVAAGVVRQLDPDRVGFWYGVAFAFLGYAAITAAYLVRARRSTVARVAVAGASIAAVAGGAALAVPMLLTDGDFEGYIVLMGFVLGGQGLAVLAHIARQYRSISVA